MRTQIYNLIITATVLNASVAGADGELSGVHLRKRVRPGMQPYCGVDSLYVACLATRQRLSLSLRTLQERLPLRPDGCSAEDIVEAGKSLNIQIDPVKSSLDNIVRFRRPAILFVDGNHFVALLDSDASGRLVVYDNAFGMFDCTKAAFAEKYKWNGDSLVIGGVPSLIVEIGKSFWVTIVAVLGIGLSVRRNRSHLGKE